MYATPVRRRKRLAPSVVPVAGSPMVVRAAGSPLATLAADSAAAGSGANVTDVSVRGDSGSDCAAGASAGDVASVPVAAGLTSFEAASAVPSADVAAGTAVTLGPGASLLGGGVARRVRRRSTVDAAVDTEDVARDLVAGPAPAATSRAGDVAADVAPDTGGNAVSVKLCAEARGCSPALPARGIALRVIRAPLTTTPTPTRISGTRPRRGPLAIPASGVEGLTG